MAAIDLCTLTEVREFLQKETGLTSSDALLSSLITRYSKAINIYCNRQFTPAETNTSHYFEVQGRVIDLSPYDLNNISGGSHYIKLNGTTLTSDDYRLYPRTMPDGVYTSIELSSNALANVTPSHFNNTDLEIKANWGFTSVPDDVKHWAIIAVAIGYRADAAAFSTSFSIDEDRLTRPESLPSAVRSGLNHYKRISVG